MLDDLRQPGLDLVEVDQAAFGLALGEAEQQVAGEPVDAAEILQRPASAVGEASEGERRVLPRAEVGRQVPTEHAVVDDAEGVEIALRPHRHLGPLPARLGRQVVEGAHHHACVGHFRALAGDLRRAEVDELHPAVLVEHDVAGLEIAVGDLPAAEEANGPEHAQAHGGGLRGSEASIGSRLEVVLECHAVDQLGHVVIDAVELIAPVAEHPHDVLVANRGQGLKLAKEELDELRRRAELREGHLDDDGLFLGVFCQVHGAHAPAAELAQDGVPADGGDVGVGRHPQLAPLGLDLADPGGERLVRAADPLHDRRIFAQLLERLERRERPEPSLQSGIEGGQHRAHT